MTPYEDRGIIGWIGHSKKSYTASRRASPPIRFSHSPWAPVPRRRLGFHGLNLPLCGTQVGSLFGHAALNKCTL
jgi:hypothetical protein